MNGHSFVVILTSELFVSGNSLLGVVSFRTRWHMPCILNEREIRIIKLHHFRSLPFDVFRLESSRSRKPLRRMWKPFHGDFDPIFIGCGNAKLKNPGTRTMKAQFRGGISDTLCGVNIDKRAGRITYGVGSKNCCDTKCLHVIGYSFRNIIASSSGIQKEAKRLLVWGRVQERYPLFIKIVGQISIEYYIGAILTKRRLRHSAKEIRSPSRRNRGKYVI